MEFVESICHNGKEWQDELGLNMYDYFARNYDPAIGRWMNIDPLEETSLDWSPYAYALNNPVYFIDPDGMQADDFGYDDKTGEIKLLRETDDKTDKLIALNKKGEETKNVVENVAKVYLKMV